MPKETFETLREEFKKYTDKLYRNVLTETKVDKKGVYRRFQDRLPGLKHQIEEGSNPLLSETKIITVNYLEEVTVTSKRSCKILNDKKYALAAAIWICLGGLEKENCNFRKIKLFLVVFFDLNEELESPEEDRKADSSSRVEWDETLEKLIHDYVERITEAVEKVTGDLSFNRIPRHLKTGSFMGQFFSCSSDLHKKIFAVWEYVDTLEKEYLLTIRDATSSPADLEMKSYAPKECKL